jgi:hypothetical protein
MTHNNFNLEGDILVPIKQFLISIKAFYDAKNKSREDSY